MNRKRAVVMSFAVVGWVVLSGAEAETCVAGGARPYEFEWANRNADESYRVCPHVSLLCAARVDSRRWKGAIGRDCKVRDEDVVRCEVVVSPHAKFADCKVLYLNVAPCEGF